MLNFKKSWFLLLLRVGVAFASNQTTSEISSNVGVGVCAFKTLVSGVLPTLSLLMFIVFSAIAAFAFILLVIWIWQHNKKNPDAKVSLRNFGSLTTNMKTAILIFALVELPWLLGGIIGIILAVLAPSIVNAFLGGGSLSGCN